jgi:hypothetical protein
MNADQRGSENKTNPEKADRPAAIASWLQNEPTAAGACIQVPTKVTPAAVLQNEVPAWAIWSRFTKRIPLTFFLIFLTQNELGELK